MPFTLRSSRRFPVQATVRHCRVMLRNEVRNNLFHLESPRHSWVQWGAPYSRLVLWGVLVFSLAVSLNGCIRYYDRVLKEPTPAPERAGTLSFWLAGTEIDAGDHPVEDSQTRFLHRTFEEVGGYAVAELRKTPLEHGLHITVERTLKTYEPSGLYTLFARAIGPLCTVSVLTLTIIPCSIWEDLIVEFHVYRDNNLERRYWYKAWGQSWAWIGLLPVAWVEFLFSTNTSTEAFEAITYDFMKKAARDGLFDHRTSELDFDLNRSIISQAYEEGVVQ